MKTVRLEHFAKKFLQLRLRSLRIAPCLLPRMFITYLSLSPALCFQKAISLRSVESCESLLAALSKLSALTRNFYLVCGRHPRVLGNFPLSPGAVTMDRKKKNSQKKKQNEKMWEITLILQAVSLQLRSADQGKKHATLTLKFTSEMRLRIASVRSCSSFNALRTSVSCWWCPRGDLAFQFRCSFLCFCLFKFHWKADDRWGGKWNFARCVLT